MNKKFGLGKGLGALIPEQDMMEEEFQNGQSILIDINKIKPNSEQPRKSFDEAKIMELSESIKQHGLIQPLVVKKQNDNYIIVAGERRWRASKKAGVSEVPAVVMDLTDSEVLEISLIENIQRQDLNPIEEALAFKKLISDFNLTQDELSMRIGRSRTAIANTMRLLNLDDRVQDYVIDGVISEGHGRTLLAVNNKDMQYTLAQKVIDEKLSVRQLESLIKSLGKDKKKVTDNDLNPYYNDIKERLQNYFGTKVNINSKKNKGKIEIEYYSEDDLQRILDMMEV
ncbi:chromosome partitioning protein, ParB family [Clostridium amylolyticum]|uniref:Chromosome partitioning protein, ParB family n=1 Tax=Clostridium amylolyticum TaxID=1121298 RepID=A0A1M6FUG8_9CLOT|nr:ParB/RepB/Spo0J family partition protein [Clostridium amylolyticum]SHJ01283.1 chromosome partitioning protein, ParB family [Clostridium amylolyticum]